MYKKMVIFGVIIFSIWGGLSVVELMTRPEDQPLSIFTHLFLYVGISYVIYVYITIGFIKFLSLDRIIEHLDESKLHRENVEKTLNEISKKLDNESNNT